MKRLIDWLVNRAKKTPYFHLPNYMERYWLIPYGKVPFNLFAIRIHHILSSDDARAFHDHPWSFLTIILKGGYTEVTPIFKSGIYQGEKRVWYGPGSVNFRRANTWHRLEVPEGQTAWTLFTTFKYKQKWGFLVHPDSKLAYNDYFDKHGVVQQNAGNSESLFGEKDEKTNTTA